VLALEYNAELDKLFVLATKIPVTSSVVVLCVFDVPTGIDEVFDQSEYVGGYDEKGDPIKVDQLHLNVSTKIVHSKHYRSP
jgi:hypothetical protein